MGEKTHTKLRWQEKGVPESRNSFSLPSPVISYFFVRGRSRVVLVKNFWNRFFSVSRIMFAISLSYLSGKGEEILIQRSRMSKKHPTVRAHYPFWRVDRETEEKTLSNVHQIGVSECTSLTFLSKSVLGTFTWRRTFMWPGKVREHRKGEINGHISSLLPKLSL